MISVTNKIKRGGKVAHTQHVESCKIAGEVCTNYVVYRYNIAKEVVVEEKDKKRDKNIEETCKKHKR